MEFLLTSFLCLESWIEIYKHLFNHLWPSSFYELRLLKYFLFLYNFSHVWGWVLFIFAHVHFGIKKYHVNYEITRLRALQGIEYYIWFLPNLLYWIYFHIYFSRFWTYLSWQSQLRHHLPSHGRKRKRQRFKAKSQPWWHFA